MSKVKIGKFICSYNKPHDGGGIKFYKDFIRILKNKKFGSALEFCSGPGFIGLGLLSSKICSELVLVDVNKKLKKNLDKTIKQNNLNQTVSYFFGNGLSALKSKKKFDLIVSNPPHIDLNNKRFKLPPQTKKIIYDDTDFLIHKNFFYNAHKFLNKDGIILFIENSLQSVYSDLVDKRKYNKLKFLKSPKTKLKNKYYIYAKRVH